MASGSQTRAAAQKKSLHATERDTEANQKRRAEFLERIREIPPERLIYLDESGVTTQMTRLYARGLGGARIAEAAPQDHWKILTILGAMSTRGISKHPVLAVLTVTRAKCPRIHLWTLTVTTGLFRRGGSRDGGDVPGQELCDAIDRVVGDARQ
jgi:hypothetical protein